MKKYINNLSNFQKIKYLVILVIFVLFISVGIPTLARIKNRNIIIPVTSWDGVMATNYNSGTGIETDPYVISTGGELAYFSYMLETNNYENTYFKLTRDIVLNDGIFSFDETNGLEYILNNTTYYIEEYTNNYYDNVERTGSLVGAINLLNSLKNFKGSFDGASFRIKGLYITDITANEIALFTNLEGTVHDLYVENAIVYGGTITGGIASTANNANLKNIIFNGHVIGRNNLVDKEEHIILNNPTIIVPLIETSEILSLVNNIPLAGSEIVSTSLTGSCAITSPNGGVTTLKINNEIVSCDGFNINLGTSLLNDVMISSVTDTSDVTITFANLTYNINYRKNIAGGIAAVAKNSTLTNLINKGTITGYSLSGGVIGMNINSSLNRSYNTGIINTSNIGGGLIGSIEKSDASIVIDKCYNANPLTLNNTGGLIGTIKDNTGIISINNSFDSASSTYLIYSSNSSVVINNSYYVSSIPINEGTTTNDFIQTTLNDLSTKDYIITNLGYSEFINLNDLFVNDANAWIYDNYSLPILFIDDVNVPVANINVSTTSWNNFTTEVDTLTFTSNIMFSIENVNNITPARARYYYLSSNVLSKSELEESRNGLESFSWTNYTDPLAINKDGHYIIYAKIIDYNNYVSYVNTDLLILDKTGPSITISLDSNNWNAVNTTLNNLYINQNKTISVLTNDALGQVTNTYYYLANTIINPSDITEWVPYTEPINLTELGTYIVYVKSIDSNNNISYANSDYIVYNGYTETFNIGRNNNNYGVNNITDKSLVTLNFTFTGNASNANIYSHNLVSNINIPINTKITLKDNVNNKNYEYIASEELNAIPFTLFKEIGVGSITKMFAESAYYTDGVVNENFTVIVDLSNTNIVTNYPDVRMHLELKDNNNVIRPTLNNTITNFNIYNNVDGLSSASSLNLSTTYGGNRMIFNSNTSINIDFTSNLLYSTINGQNIIDTTKENKSMGIAIKMVDGAGNMMGSDYLKNVKFRLDNIDYYPDSDNIIRISLNENTSSHKILTIITNQNDNNFVEGTYYFKINNYIATGGLYYEELNQTEINIPVLVTNTYTQSNYSFDVIMEDGNKIISKANANVIMPLKILKNGYLYNPNIRVSLYKKDTMSAYDQNYSIVDLRTHVTNELTLVGNNVYYVTETPIDFNGSLESYNMLDLNLITNNFENTGYKLVFELFAGNKKVGTIEKYFIVK